MSTTETLPQPALGAPGEHCAHCGAALAADQRYCLNCGLRRTGPRVEYRELLLGEGAAAGAAPPPPPEPPAAASAAPPAADDGSRAISPLGAAVAIGLLLLATLLGAVIGRGTGDDAAQQPVVVGGAPAAAAAGAVTSEWQAGDAWTVQLQAFPKEGTTPAQVQQAKADAQAKGAADVGVLITDDYPSLTAGQYVIYSGSYPKKADADKALEGLKANFPDAVVVQVSKTAAAAEEGAAAGAAAEEEAQDGGSSGGGAAPPAAVQELENTAPEDYSKKSRKLPDKVGTGGTPPPTDDQAPGGGEGGGETIG
jgi:hypothetical protein